MVLSTYLLFTQDQNHT